MAHEIVEAFIEKIRTDEAFRSKIMSADSLDERIKLINQEGFNITAEDLRDFERGLGDSDLDN